ncbi:major coat protein [Marinobacter gelidimuriae]|uniref:major coat protein n=1 Tax=Marinobacter gelidimuriae TaxID=2739064 RepID=UPI00036BB0D9|nr:major coat protein [Marinobacter gelidimuriae]
MKKTLKLVKKNGVLVVVAGGFTALSTSAAAELPVAVGTAFTGISSDFAALLVLAWPVLGTIVGGFIVMKLFKKFANKAT